MSSLDGLIRLHRSQLDEKRRALAELQALAERLRSELERLDAEVTAEEAAARAEEVAFSFAAYAEAARGRRLRLTQSIAQVDARIAAGTDEIAAAFQELKRYELAQQERERRVKLKERRRATARLDEVASTRFLRRQTEER